VARFQLGGDGPVSAEDRQAAEQREARIRRDADPLVLRRTDRWLKGRMLPTPKPLPMALKPQKTHFDSLADWNCGYLGVRDEYDISYELRQDLKQAVPQSILRDVYRPIHRPQVELTYHNLERDPGARLAYAEAKAAQKREPVPVVEPGLLTIVQEQQRRRRFLNSPWPSHFPDSAPRRVYSQEGNIRYIEVDGSDDDDDDDRSAQQDDE
jgi:hypothetical protein